METKVGAKEGLGHKQIQLWDHWQVLGDWFVFGDNQIQHSQDSCDILKDTRYNCRKQVTLSV